MGRFNILRNNICINEEFLHKLGISECILLTHYGNLKFYYQNTQDNMCIYVTYFNNIKLIK